MVDTVPKVNSNMNGRVWVMRWREIAREGDDETSANGGEVSFVFQFSGTRMGNVRSLARA